MKKEFHYEVICENLFMEETGNYRTYGIKGNSEDPLTGVLISDVSVDRGKVQSLVDTFNQLQLDTIHLQEAVEDFLAENGIDTSQ